jgi:hypothetical protein
MLVAQQSRGIEDQHGLTEAEKKEVAELKKRDAEVKAHEQAHAMAGGPYAGAPTYQYENGPDGRQYAVAGHVSIDVSPVEGDPQATIEKMQVVKKAANAPMDPSAQDRSVAAKADQEIREARQELGRERTEEAQEGFSVGGPRSVIGLNQYEAGSVGHSDSKSHDPGNRRSGSFDIVA